MRRPRDIFDVWLCVNFGEGTEADTIEVIAQPIEPQKHTMRAAQLLLAYCGCTMF